MIFRVAHFRDRLALALAGLAVLSQVTGCGESSFSGGSKVGTKKKETTSSNVLPSGQPLPSGSPQNPSLTVSEGGRACVRGGSTRVLNLSVAPHVDSSASGQFGATPTADVAVSAVARIDRNEIGGDLLPIADFVLDDIAMLVKEDVQTAQVLQCGDCSRDRAIHVPAHAILVYDYKNPNYAEGSLDSKASTTYYFEGRSVNLPGNQRKTLRDVASLGIPLIAANAIRIEDMKRKGFINAQGQIAFKVIHVSHRWGTVSMTFRLQPCQ
ncbi:hypothetical protein EBZ80_09360 [bacterium]|nr:hypothetical protein [bacterium]